MRIKKKHQAGAAKNFITRTQAVKKLQVSLADFRRLCIFKGIFPREPRNKKKANKGSTANVTFYYTKDIQYLMHEPVLQKFREHKTFSKKLTRLLGRNELNDAVRLDKNRPKYTLDHIIKERYPSFNDALRDVDDALSMIFLFANLPASDKVSQKFTEDAEKICMHWMAYVARENLLRKVFVSIKGVYYQAVIRGQEVTWLVPFKFPQNVPSDVDFRIMLTFLEFYVTLLRFVLYKLYTDSNLVYPPAMDMAKINGVGGLSAYILKSKADQIKSIADSSAGDLKGSSALKKTTYAKIKTLKLEEIEQNQENVMDEDEDEPKNEDEAPEQEEEVLDEFQPIKSKSNTAVEADVLIQPPAHDSPQAELFKDMTFFVGREVPLDIIEFLIVACGGKLISEAAMDELSEEAQKKVDLSKVTHQVCDREVIATKVAGRTYIQPQWIFDSINKGTLLNVNDYAPGETLPPHLSPWGDAGGYDPEAAVEIDEEAEGESGEESVDEDAEEQEAEESDSEDEEYERQKEIEMEAKGVTYSKAEDSKPKAKKAKRTKSTQEQEEEEAKQLKLMMMSNKQKKLYKKMQYSNEKKESRQEELVQKKRKLEKEKRKLEKKARKN